MRQASFPRNRRGHPEPGFHGRRHRRHGRRRVRQRHAAVAAHPAGGGLQSSTHLPGPGPRRGALVQGARAAVPPAALVLGGLLEARDLQGRRRVLAQRQEPDAVARGPGAARTARTGDAQRSDQGDSQGARRSIVERRHRNLRQGEQRVAQRRRRPQQRRAAHRCGAAQLQGGRRRRKPRLLAARPHRVRAPRRPAQHGLHRQLRRRELLGRRGQHQDPPERRSARPGNHARGARSPAGADDGRGGGAGPAQQLSAGTGDQYRRVPIQGAAERERVGDPRARALRGPQSRTGIPALRGRDRRAPQGRRGPHAARSSRSCSRTARSGCTRR